MMEGGSPPEVGSGGRSGGAGPPVDDPLLAAILDLASGHPSEESCRRIFHAYYRRIKGYFIKRQRSPEAAEDLTQKAFERVYTSRGSFTTLSEFEGWLFTIARNLHRNALRDRQAGTRGGEEPLDLLSELDLARIAVPGTVAEPDDPLASCLRQEEAERVRRTLARLPDQARRCVALRYYQELKYREIAQVMGLAVDTVKAHLYQAKGRLKELLADDLDGLDDLDDPEEVP